jgi:hypothetical protein
MAGVMRMAASLSGRCWICGMSAVSGERLPGRRHRVRLLCKRHDELVFGARTADMPQLQNRVGEPESGAVGDGAGRRGEAGLTPPK